MKIMISLTEEFNILTPEEEKSIFSKSMETEAELQQIMYKGDKVKKIKTSVYTDNDKCTNVPTNEATKALYTHYANNYKSLQNIEIPQLKYEEYIVELMLYTKHRKDIQKHITRYYINLKGGYYSACAIILNKYKEKPIIVSEIIFNNEIRKRVFYDLYQVVDKIQEAINVVPKANI